MRDMLAQEFDRVFAILQQSFPNAEYRPYGEQKALLRDPRYRILVEGDTQIRAVLAVWELGDLVFVEHFAVDPAVRGRGIGTAMMRAFTARDARRLCLEVELPETETARRRIAFYERLGFTCNGYGYEQPPLSRGKSAVPLLLMTTQGGVTEEQFCAIRARLYREVYKVKNCKENTLGER